MDLKLALKVNDADNVATIFAEGLIPNTAVEVRDKQGNSEIVAIRETIPYGHKIAVSDIPAQGKIIKYGEEIGLASRPIAKGGHVHVHNLESQRGRGDLAGKRMAPCNCDSTDM